MFAPTLISSRSPLLGARLRKGALLCVTLLVTLPLANIAATQELTGTVVRIADGDTLTLLKPNKEQVRIRLAEIDAPESEQPFGNKSKQTLIAMCAQKKAVVAVQDIDRYGRTIGRVYCDGVDTSAEQVRIGMAWVYDSYVRDRGLYDLQSVARTAKSGLWVDPNPIKPWLWRKGERGKVLSAEPVQGNQSSRIYHLPGCPSYGAMSKKNIVGFSSEQEARAAGYRKARNCP